MSAYTLSSRETPFDLFQDIASSLLINFAKGEEVSGFSSVMAQLRGCKDLEQCVRLFRNDFDTAVGQVLEEAREAKYADTETQSVMYDLDNAPSAMVNILNWPVHHLDGPDGGSNPRP